MALSNYLKGLLTNEEVIKELLDLAKEIAQNEQVADSLGLNAEEKAFYDALTRPQAVKDFYTNEQLVNLTKELTEELRKNRTIDWQKKESARAGMRSKVKRLLKKYKYPPEEEQSALETVIHQCEQWADVDSSEYEDYSYGTSQYVDGYAPKSYEFYSEYRMVAEPEGPKYGSKNDDNLAK